MSDWFIKLKIECLWFFSFLIFLGPFLPQFLTLFPFFNFTYFLSEFSFIICLTFLNQEYHTDYRSSMYNIAYATEAF